MGAARYWDDPEANLEETTDLPLPPSLRAELEPPLDALPDPALHAPRAPRHPRGRAADVQGLQRPPAGGRATPRPGGCARAPAPRRRRVREHGPAPAAHFPRAKAICSLAAATTASV